MPISKVRVVVSALLLGSHVLCSQTPRATQKNPCDSLTKTDAWQKTHTELQKDFQRLFKPDQQNQILSSEKSAVLSAITSDSDFEPLFEARYWMSGSFDNAKSMIPDLIDRLTDSKVIGLTNSADVIILERIESKDLTFYGHGWGIPDDLFQIAGRASWLLKEVTGENFGDVKPNSSASDLKRLQERWAAWYSRFDCQ